MDCVSNLRRASSSWGLTVAMVRLRAACRYPSCSFVVYIRIVVQAVVNASVRCKTLAGIFTLAIAIEREIEMYECYHVVAGFCVETY